jgi:hypothetical protein
LCPAVLIEKEFRSTSADPQQWRRHVRNYARVRYQALYPGVDSVHYGNQRQLEYDLMVAPGADGRAIKLRFTGAWHVRIGVDGALRLQMAGGRSIWRLIPPALPT